MKFSRKARQCEDAPTALRADGEAISSRCGWLGVLLPEHCVLCGTTTRQPQLCSGCQADLPRLTNACMRCAEPMPVAGEQLCGRCQQSPPAFNAVYSPFLYEEPIASLIQQLKFDHKLDLARTLGTLLGNYLSHALHTHPDLIIPVPMHRRRLGQRGFNQALELARFAARQLGVPVAAGMVCRSKATPPQLGLTMRERKSNVRNVFRLRQKLPPDTSILLLDDVMTTGMTVNSLARELMKHGAAEITVATVARAALRR